VDFNEPKETAMSGQYDRNRDAEGRFRSGSRGGQQQRGWDDDREQYGRGQETPRDDRGRFMSEGESGRYYGGTDFDDYGDRNYGSRYDSGENYRGGHGGYSRSSSDEYESGPGFSDYRRQENRGGQDERQYGGGRYGDDDEYSSRGQQSQGRERDEYGRFTSEDVDYGDRGRGERWQGSRGSRDDDDRGRGSGQGRGWFGDSGGHSEAARQRGPGQRGQDDRGQYSRDDDHRGRGAGQGRGWFGDSEGHSEAARQRGQGSRGSSGGNRDRDDRGRFASDDDHGGGRGRGGSQGRSGGDDHRGWFGDSRGHSHAARLGWRHRGQ
jgi:hypothetical protein